MPLSAKASLFFLAANIFQKAIMVVFTPVFTRIMTTEEFAQYAVFQSWETIFTVFVTLNISSYATAKALVEFKDKQDDFISSAEFLTILLVLFFLGIFLIVKSFIGEINAFPTWVSILLFVDMASVAFFSFWSQSERFNQRYKSLTVVSIATGMLSPIIAFTLIVFSKDIGLYKGWARIIGLVLTNGIAAIFILYWSIKKSKAFFVLKYWKYCIQYCLPLIPHFLSMAFLLKIGQLFVDRYCGGNMSGIYALANSLALLMMVFNDALTKTLVPWTYQKMAIKSYNEIKKPITIALIIIAILDIAMALVAPELVRIFANSTYYDAIYAIPPLVAVCFFGFLYNTFANIEYYFKETKYVSFASVCAGVVILTANFLLVPKFGYIAAAYSTWFSYVVYAIMHYVFMRQTIKKHIDGMKIYDDSFILKVSLIFSAIIACIPILYKYTEIRWSIIGFIIVFAIVMRKSIKKTACILKKEKT